MLRCAQDIILAFVTCNLAAGAAGATRAAGAWVHGSMGLSLFRLLRFTVGMVASTSQLQKPDPSIY